MPDHRCGDDRRGSDVSLRRGGRARVRAVQRVVTLDMEGVLTPEIWIAVADDTGIADLRITTREEPDYQKLMDFLNGHVLFGLQENFQHLESIFETIDLFLLEKLFKLFFLHYCLVIHYNIIISYNYSVTI